MGLHNTSLQDFNFNTSNHSGRIDAKRTCFPRYRYQRVTQEKKNNIAYGYLRLIFTFLL